MKSILTILVSLVTSHAFAADTSATYKKCSVALGVKDKTLTDEEVINKFNELKETYDSYGTTSKGQINRRVVTRSHILSAVDACSHLSNRTSKEISFDEDPKTKVHLGKQRFNPRIKNTDDMDDAIK